MKVNEAVKLAKSYAKDLFSGEIASDVRLEEVEFDDVEDTWKITVGFWRYVSGKPNSALADIAKITGPPTERSFKIVCIRDIDGRVISLKHRSIPSAE